MTSSHQHYKIKFHAFEACKFMKTVYLLPVHENTIISISYLNCKTPNFLYKWVVLMTIQCLACSCWLAPSVKLTITTQLLTEPSKSFFFQILFVLSVFETNFIHVKEFLNYFPIMYDISIVRNRQ